MIRGKEGKRSINTTNERWRSQVALSVKSGDRRNTYIYIYISTKEFPLPPLSRIFEKILVVYYFLNPKDTTVRRASVLMNFPPPPFELTGSIEKRSKGISGRRRAVLSRVSNSVWECLWLERRSEWNSDVIRDGQTRRNARRAVEFSTKLRSLVAKVKVILSFFFLKKRRCAKVDTA